MPAVADDYLALKEQGGVADLSDRAKFRLTGADRVRYLNGQVTANVLRLGVAEAIPACVTTAKGRLSGEIFISPAPDALLIDAEPELRESLFSRLERYIISDNAGLEDATESLALFHVLLPDDEVRKGALRTKLADLQPRNARRFGPAGFDLFVPSAEAAALRARLADLRDLVPAVLEVVRIEHGVPRWGRELGEETLPPEAGLDATHVDYHKGCYIGQEVISRLKSVGHVNRRLVGFTRAEPTPGDSTSLLPPGLRVFAATDDTKQIGEITSTAFSFALAKPIALGYLRREAPMAGLLGRPASADESAIPLVAQNLPFV